MKEWRFDVKSWAIGFAAAMLIVEITGYAGIVSLLR